jgi:hypothetical protein
MKMKTIRIGELDIRVVGDEEANEADICVCVLADAATPFTDNVFDVCRDCGRAIQYRPHVPKKPPKICVECAVNRMKEDNLGG